MYLHFINRYWYYIHIIVCVCTYILLISNYWNLFLRYFHFIFCLFQRHATKNTFKGRFWILRYAKTIPWLYRMPKQYRNCTVCQKSPYNTVIVPYAKKHRTIPWLYRLPKKYRTIPWLHRMPKQHRTIPWLYRMPKNTVQYRNCTVWQNNTVQYRDCTVWQCNTVQYRDCTVWQSNTIIPYNTVIHSPEPLHTGRRWQADSIACQVWARAAAVGNRYAGAAAS